MERRRRGLSGARDLKTEDRESAKELAKLKSVDAKAEEGKIQAASALADVNNGKNLPPEAPGTQGNNPGIPKIEGPEDANQVAVGPGTPPGYVGSVPAKASDGCVTEVELMSAQQLARSNLLRSQDDTDHPFMRQLVAQRVGIYKNVRFTGRISNDAKNDDYTYSLLQTVGNGTYATFTGTGPPSEPLAVRKRRISELVLRASFCTSQQPFAVQSIRSGRVRVRTPAKNWMRGGYLTLPPPSGVRSSGKSKPPGFALATPFESLTRAWYDAGVCDQVAPYSPRTAVEELLCNLPPQGCGDAEIYMDHIASLLSLRAEWPKLPVNKGVAKMSADVEQEYRIRFAFTMDPGREPPALLSRRCYAAAVAIPTMPAIDRLNNVLGGADGMHAVPLSDAFFLPSAHLQFLAPDQKTYQDSVNKLIGDGKLPSNAVALAVGFDAARDRLHYLTPGLPASGGGTQTCDGDTFTLMATTCAMVQLPFYGLAVPWETSDNNVTFPRYQAFLEAIENEWILLSIEEAHGLGHTDDSHAAAKSYLEACKANSMFDYGSASATRKGSHRTFSTEPFLLAAYSAEHAPVHAQRPRLDDAVPACAPRRPDTGAGDCVRRLRESHWDQMDGQWE